MTTLRLSDIKFDSAIYPRQQWNTTTIARYADAMEAGAVFPPLILEQDTNRLLDGKHRLEAYKQWHGDLFASAEVSVEYRAIPEGMTPRYYAGTLSSAHGDRLSNADIKEIAEAEFEDDPTIDPKAWGEGLGVSERTVYRWVSHILKRERDSRESKAWRLYRLGWEQKEIASRLGVTQQTVSNDTKNCHLAKIGDTLGSDWNDKGIAEEANRLNLPLIDCYASAMTDLSDAARMQRLGITLQPYDVWNFTKSHELFGASWPGRIPGQLIAQVLYFFTQPGDLVIDPMAGSGTTVDVCLALHRKCYAFDIDDALGRPDILTYDIAQDGWPDRVKHAQLIFWDPPYFDKKADEYIEGSISALPRDAYLDFFAERFAEAFTLVKPGTRLAFLMSDWNDNEGQGDMIGVWDYVARMQQAGWAIRRHIMTPLSTQQVHPDIVTKFRASRKLARLGRSLIVGIKP